MRVGIVEEMGLVIGHAWCKYLTIMSQLVKGLCTLWLRKKIKTADLHDKVLLPRSFELGFDPVMRDVGASAPAVWYAGRFAKPRC